VPIPSTSDRGKSASAHLDGGSPGNGGGISIARITSQPVPCARIRGRVVDRESRAAVPGAEVTASTSGFAWASGARATSDAGGAFELALTPGVYQLVARRDGRVGRLNGRLLAGIGGPPNDITIAIARGTTLRGRVVDGDRTPVTGAAIQLGADQRRRTLARSGGDGRFTVEGLLPGQYWVTAEAEGQIAESVPVMVGESASPVLTIVLARSVTIRGTVRDAAGAVAGASVRVQWTARLAGDGTMRATATTTHSDGTFEVGPLPPGPLTVRAAHGERGTGEVMTRAQPGEVVAVRINLEGGAFIEGTVTWDDGRAAADLLVAALSRERRFAAVATAADGRYRLGPLAGHGPVTVVASATNAIRARAGDHASATLDLGPTDRRTGVDVVVRRPVLPSGVARWDRPREGHRP
jgi:Carboxypeptidase regulatory-like domain